MRVVINLNFVSFADVSVISGGGGGGRGVGCCSEKLIDAIEKSDYLMHEI